MDLVARRHTVSVVEISPRLRPVSTGARNGVSLCHPRLKHVTVSRQACDSVTRAARAILGVTQSTLTLG